MPLIILTAHTRTQRRRLAGDRRGAELTTDTIVNYADFARILEIYIKVGYGAHWAYFSEGRRGGAKL